MSIGTLGRLAPEYAKAGNAAQRAGGGFGVGEKFELTVLERLQRRRYRVLVGNSQRTVDSSAELTPGTQLTVQVTANGPRLVLQGVDPQIAGLALLESIAALKSGSALSGLAQQHRVALDAEASALIEQAMQDSTDPGAMAAAGLFLGKLGLALDAADLHAVYEAQVWAAGSPPMLVSARALAAAEVGQIAKSLLTHFKTAEPVDAAEPGTVTNQQQPQESTAQADVAADAEDSAGDARGRRSRAIELLNTHDRGSVGYQYGVLPLLIADQLVELDVVCMHTTTAADSASRRLTMAFNSAALGRVEVQAHAAGTQLVLKIRTASAPSSAALAAHADDVRALVARLGWNVESLSYGHDAQLPRAATQIVQHVLNAETLSRLL